MRHKIAIISTFLLFTLSLQAGKIEKAFEALEVYNYFMAKEIFEERLEKDIVAAPYGLSIVFGRKDNPFHNLDSAYKYICIADSNFLKIEEKDKESLLELNIDSLSVEIWKDTIDYAYYKVVRSIHQTSAYQFYIDRHIDSDLRENAIEARNLLAFEEAKAKNSSAAYLKYINDFPDAKQRYEAQNRFEERLYKEQTLNGAILDYQKFVKNFPESPFQDEAQDSIYFISTRSKTIDSFHQFILKNPNNKNVEIAWRSIYKLYTADFSPQRIIEFRIDYPAFPFLEELKQDMKLSVKKFLPFTNSAKWGFMDTEGTVMINPSYEDVDEFSDGLALVVNEGKVGYINKSNEIIIPFEYDEGEAFIEGLAIASKDDLYGVINRLGETIVSFEYDFIGPYNNGLAVVANDTAYGFINRKGEIQIPIEFDYAGDFKDGFAIIEKDGYKGMINTLGKTVVPSIYQWLEPFNKQGYCRAKNDSLYGILDKNSAEVLSFEYDQIDNLLNGHNIIVKGDKYGYVNDTGEIVIPIKYEFNPSIWIQSKFKNGYASYYQNGKLGIIDTSGKKIFPAIFEDVGQYVEEGLVAVKKRGKWGYSNQSLRLIIPYEYEETRSSENAKGIVKKDGMYGILNEKEEILLPIEYDKIEYLEGTGYLVNKEQLNGLMDLDLNLLLPLEYKSIKTYNDNYLKITKEGEINYYDLKLNSIIAKE